MARLSRRVVVAGLLLGVAGCGRGTPPAEYAALRAKADAEFDQAFAQGLAAQGLTAAPIPGQIVRLEMDSHRDNAPGDTVSRFEDSPEKIVLFAFNNEQNANEPRAYFARDNEGKLWLVFVKVEPKGYDYATIPGCSSGYDKGVTPADYYLGVVLPPGTSVEGSKAVTVSVRLLQTFYADGSCDRGPAKP